MPDRPRLCPRTLRWVAEELAQERQLALDRMGDVRQEIPAATAEPRDAGGAAG